MSGTLTCKQLVMLISEYFDGVLSEGVQARFDEHIAGCGNCSSYLEQLRTTIRLVGKLRENDIEPAARETLLSTFRDWKSRPAGA